MRALAGEREGSVQPFSGLRGRCSGEDEFVGRQLALGMDVMVDLGSPPFALGPGVRVERWEEPARPHPLLHKVYHTPAGDLYAIVRRTSDWPHGDDIPLMSDFVIPRAVKFPVEGPDDLELLRCLLGQPAAEERAAYLAQALEPLARGGRFILAPVDDVRIEVPDDALWARVWRNVETMVGAWREMR